MKVVAVPVRDDNYAYLLIDEPSKKAAAVDPYDVTKVAAAAQGMGVEIVAAITTHHHYDHAGGNKTFASTYPGVTIYGGSEQVSAVTKIVKDKEEFTIGENTHVKCLATPCHTQDSICYYITDKTGAHPGGVFTGDTLFVGGCGRFFEGTADEMHAALSYLGTLPDKTVVYNGHEYTAGNAAFAKNIDPEGSSVARLVALAKENKLTTGQTTIGDEKEWNVFMRLGDEIVKKASGAASGDTTAVMDALRNGKNTFKGSL